MVKLPRTKYVEDKKVHETNMGELSNVETVNSVKPAISQAFFHTQAQSMQHIVYPLGYTRTRIHSPRQEILEKNRVLTNTSDKSVVDIYKQLRTQVIRKLMANKWKSVAVISARAGQGATLTAVNLGISIARDHRFTALIADFNLSNPAVHSFFDYEPEEANTLSAYFSGETGIEDVLVNPGIESLVFIPGCSDIAHSSEMLMSPKAQQLVNEINKRYCSRIVIYDLPPILESDDAMATLDYFDACLIVIEEGVTTKTDMHRVSELIGNKPVLGVVYNNAS